MFYLYHLIRDCVHLSKGRWTAVNGSPPSGEWDQVAWSGSYTDQDSPNGRVNWERLVKKYCQIFNHHLRRAFCAWEHWLWPGKTNCKYAVMTWMKIHDHEWMRFVLKWLRLLFTCLVNSVCRVTDQIGSIFQKEQRKKDFQSFSMDISVNSLLEQRFTSGCWKGGPGFGSYLTVRLTSL